MGEFAENKLGKLLRFANGRTSPERADGRPFPVFGSNGVIGWADETNSEAGSLIIGRVGSYCGSLYLAKEKCWVTDNAIRANSKGGNDPQFLFYLLSTLNLNNWRAGSGQPLLNQQILSNIRVSVPPPKKQRAIASILGALDDKIDLHRRMNETLEAMARAIFRDWFVDFGPTRAKMEGREPYLASEIWGLFPDRLDEDGKPEGWERLPLDQSFDFLEGPGIRNWQYTNSESGVRFINIRCIKNNDLVLGTANRIADDEANGKYRHFHLAENDIVVSTSGTLGRWAIVRKSHLPLMLNTSVIRFRPLTQITNLSFLWQFISNPSFMKELEMRASGSVQKNFGPMHLRQMSVLYPGEKVIKAFAGLCTPNLEAWLRNLDESNTLAQTRDLLLPKLMSGEIRVKAAEKFVEEKIG